ncbi:hypothetical protein ACI3QN_12415, partial [Propionibacterium freudenreichii]|uniref:hypothetical protein n=1 Tax=Propionibacterium freudenreichii TaxID=1744 RepID=UPI003851D288
EMSEDYIINCLALVERNYANHKSFFEWNQERSRTAATLGEEVFIEELVDIGTKYPIYTQLKNQLEFLRQKHDKNSATGNSAGYEGTR